MEATPTKLLHTLLRPSYLYEEEEWNANKLKCLIITDRWKVLHRQHKYIIDLTHAEELAAPIHAFYTMNGIVNGSLGEAIFLSQRVLLEYTYHTKNVPTTRPWCAIFAFACCNSWSSIFGTAAAEFEISNSRLSCYYANIIMP